MLGTEDLLSYRKDAAMLRLGFDGFASVIEGNGKTVARKEGIGMRRAKKALRESNDVAEPVDGFVILSLAILRVGDAGFAAHSIELLEAEGAFAGFGGAAQRLFGFTIRALLHQKIADGMLNIRPQGGVGLAIGEFFRGAKMFHRGFELNALLRGETGKLVGVDHFRGLGWKARL